MMRLSMKRCAQPLNRENRFFGYHVRIRTSMLTFLLPVDRSSDFASIHINIMRIYWDPAKLWTTNCFLHESQSYYRSWPALYWMTRLMMKTVYMTIVGRLVDSPIIGTRRIWTIIKQVIVTAAVHPRLLRWCVVGWSAALNPRIAKTGFSAITFRIYEH